METLPPSGMIADGSCYELRTPIPPRATVVSVGSASPTETSPDLELENWEEGPAKEGRHDPMRRTPRDLELWPTPTFSDGKMDVHSHTPQNWKAREIRKAAEGIALQFPLSIAIRVAREGHGLAISRDLDHLGFRLQPRTDPPGRRGPGTPKAGKTISPDSRVLNPFFLAMLMGFGPTDVTLLEPMVTASMWWRQGSRSGISSRVASKGSIES